jgi:CRISPR/Cas system-associated protein endoribonuclease Cas2
MGEFVATQIYQILCHGIEHEGIVSIGTVTEKKFHRMSLQKSILNAWVR